MMTRRKKVGTVPLWPQRQASQKARKYLILQATYISAPPERAIDGQDTLGPRLEATGKLLRTRKAYRIHSSHGHLDLIANLITEFEEHGKHGLYGKVVVNERISLR
jgi:hypothetical protein